MMDSSEKIQTQCSSSALRVLLVDDDLQVLNLEDNLKTCGYHVITCTSTRDALHLINEKKHGVDMVLCDLNMAILNGFKFLKHACLEVPVIATYNIQDETSLTLNVLQQCACCYILKSAIPQWLRNLQQCVFERRSKEVVNDIESNQAATVTSEETQMIDSNETEPQFNEYRPTGMKKRKNTEDRSHDTVKQRLHWVSKLHEKFVEAINKIGLDEVKPKKILEVMNIPGLTRDHVASHLQKYQIKLIRAQLDQQNHDDVGINNVQQKLTMNVDADRDREPVTLTQNRYTAGINMQQHNIAMTASQGRVLMPAQNLNDISICHICSAPTQMLLEQNKALYVGETQNRNDVGINNEIQNPSLKLSVQPQCPVTEIAHANNNKLGRNGFDNLAVRNLEAGDDINSANDFCDLPTLLDLGSILEDEHHFDIGNQDLTDEIQAMLGLVDDPYTLWF